MTQNSLPPIVSVVVPTCRRHDLLKACLAALDGQHFDAGGYEVLVCDDAAEEAARRLVASFAAQAAGPIRYLPVLAGHGPAAARNLGWRAARGRLIAFTDDDCLPQPGWLRAGVDALEAGADAAWGRLEMPLPPSPTDYELDAAGLSRAVFVTANCFCRRAALERVGGFDERFTAAWREDTDLYFSLLEGGCHVAHVPDAVVVHPVRPAAWGVSLRQQAKTRFDVLLRKKHPALYGRRIPPLPRSYYAIVAALLAAAAGAVLRQPALALSGALACGVLTLLFCARRLRGASKAPSHVAEMALTSALIPPLSLYWRLRGLLAFRRVAASGSSFAERLPAADGVVGVESIGALEHEVA